jgi:hypothetical protein
MHRGVKLSRLLACGALIALAGCPNDPPQQEPAASVANAHTGPSVTASPKRAPKKKPYEPKIKETKATAEADLGTLPDGVGIRVGQTAPDFELPAQARGKQSLDGLLNKGELLLVFYRGGW